MATKTVPLSQFLAGGARAAADDDSPLPTASAAREGKGEAVGTKYVVEWNGSGPLPLPPDVVKANVNNQTFTASNKLLSPPASLDVFKLRLADLVREYFDSSDVMEVIRQLEEMQMPRHHDQLVRRAIVLSLERSDREREMAAVLISSLHVRRIISSTQVFDAFIALLEMSADILLDNPTADAMLAHFLSDAVLDGCLTPTFILEPPPLSVKLGEEQLGVARRVLAEAERRLREGTALAAPSDAMHVPLQQVKATIESLIAEYLQARRAAQRARAARLPRGARRADPSAPLRPARAAQASDIGEVSRRLREGDIHLPLRHEVVKRAVRVAMQRGPKECESISRLLSALYGATLPASEIARGFEALLDESADLLIDVPDTPRLLGNFVARAVSDEVLAVSFVQQALRTKAADDAGAAALKRAKALLAIGHKSHHMARIWGPRALAATASVDEVKALFQSIVDELFVRTSARKRGRPRREGARERRALTPRRAATAADRSARAQVGHDCAEAERALTELCVPAYHHEFAKRLLRRAVEGSAADRELTASLLARLVGGAEPAIAKESVAQGFERLSEVLADLRLDTPNAEQILAGLRATTQAKGIVP